MLENQGKQIKNLGVELKRDEGGARLQQPEMITELPTPSLLPYSPLLTNTPRKPKEIEPLAESTRFQSVLATFSSEAKYIALSTDAQDALWITQFIEKITGVALSVPTIMPDSNSTRHLATITHIQ